MTLWPVLVTMVIPVQVGTYRYMAPEALDARVNLKNQQCFKQIDMYAFSLVMWEVLWRCDVMIQGGERTLPPPPSTSYLLLPSQR